MWQVFVRMHILPLVIYFLDAHLVFALSDAGLSVTLHNMIYFSLLPETRSNCNPLLYCICMDIIQHENASRKYALGSLVYLIDSGFEFHITRTGVHACVQ